MSILPAADRQSAINEAREAEKLLTAAVESCEGIRKRVDGSEAASVTRLKNGLRIALDRVGGVLDFLDPNGFHRRK